jgi:hypothetical protein
VDDLMVLIGEPFSLYIRGYWPKPDDRSHVAAADGRADHVVRALTEVWC